MTGGHSHLQWNWAAPRPAWMVIGVVSTAVILCLGTFLISSALTNRTPYENLGFMVNLAITLAVIAGTVTVLRRKIIRFRVELDDRGLQWTNVNLGQTRRITWENLERFQAIGVRRRGMLVAHNLRIWTTADVHPIVVHQVQVEGPHLEAYRRFEKSAVAMLSQHGVARR